MVAPFKSYTRDTTFSSLYRLPSGTDVRFTTLYIRRQGVTQVAPYVDTAYHVTTLRSRGFNSGFQGESVTRMHLDAATNKARKRFVDKLGDSSQLGSTATGERKASWNTVVSAVTTAALAAKAVTRGRLGEAAKILGFNPPIVRKPVRVRYKVPGKKARTGWRSREFWQMPDSRLVAKTVGNYWLWYSYGVKPLVQDTYNAMDVLQRPMPWDAFSESGTVKSTWVTSGAYPETYSSRSTIRITAHIRVSNPNLWLCNKLGLINPVQMINEAIPFSFVVDWFSNLSDVINSMTDFVGLEIAKPLTVEKSSSTLSTHLNLQGLLVPVTTEASVYYRTLSIPSPKLKFGFERFEWQRGANAISLLTQFLGKPIKPSRW